MYESDMELPGDLRVHPAARFLQRCHVQVLVTYRVNISPRDWHHHFLTPFWRLYRFSASGLGTITWPGSPRNSLAVEPGRLYLMPAWTEFKTATTGTLVHEYIHFDVRGMLPSWIKQVFTHPLELPQHPSLSRLEAEWTAALTEVYTRPLVAFGWAGALAQAAVLVATEALPQRQRLYLDEMIACDPRINACIEQLRDTHRGERDNATLAAACGLGVRQFLRRFNTATGMSPAQYRLECRITEATTLLTRSELSLDQIAEELGFTDRFYLSRVFKARMGLTPAVYRKMYAGDGRR